MTFLIRIFRLYLILVGTAFLFLSWVLGNVAFCWRRGWFVWWRCFVKGAWSSWVLFVVGCRVEVKGSLPSVPCFFVSNHLSYLDILVYSKLFPNVFVSKSDVRGWPLIGWLAMVFGTLFIRRDKVSDARRVLGLFDDVLSWPQGLVVFPEGTSTDGSHVVPFKRALFQWPALRQQPVYYGTISYVTSGSDLPAGESICYWGDMVFAPHVWRLLGLRSFVCRVVFGEAPLSGSDRRELAGCLEEAVRESL